MAELQNIKKEVNPTINKTYKYINNKFIITKNG
jgi:hypothetical protein